MKLSKKEELLALGSALYLLGLEIEASRVKLEELADAAGEDTPAAEELAESMETYKRASDEFSRLEKRFLQLKKEL